MTEQRRYNNLEIINLFQPVDGENQFADVLIGNPRAIEPKILTRMKSWEDALGYNKGTVYYPERKPGRTVRIDDFSQEYLRQAGWCMWSELEPDAKRIFGLLLSQFMNDRNGGNGLDVLSMDDQHGVLVNIYRVRPEEKGLPERLAEKLPDQLVPAIILTGHTPIDGRIPRWFEIAYDAWTSR